MEKTSQFNLALSDLAVRENADPYEVYLYLRILFDVLVKRFNMEPGHIALLEPYPLGYDNGLCLIWEDPQGLVLIPLEPSLIIKGFHTPDLWGSFQKDIRENMSFEDIAHSFYAPIASTAMFMELSTLAQNEPDLLLADRILTTYRR